MFINRKIELEQLSDLYHSDRAELFVLYGRRRVGKTELLRAFCAGKPHIFFIATLSADCKVFQDMTPVEVIELVLSDYAFASTKRLIETYPKRDYQVQYNETDFEFVTRLMQEWGINYHFEHSDGVHRLIWSDHNCPFQVTQSAQDKG